MLRCHVTDMVTYRADNLKSSRSQEGGTAHVVTMETPRKESCLVLLEKVYCLRADAQKSQTNGHVILKPFISEEKIKANIFFATKC